MRAILTFIWVSICCSSGVWNTWGVWNIWAAPAAWAAWAAQENAATPKSSPIQIVFLGDSLTEGYGVPKEKAFPALVETQLKNEGYLTVNVINAGISGSTSASGESRLRWYLKKNPDILILALGGNDGLRGMSVVETKKNLEKVVVLAQKHGVKVLLAGMQMPPNYGKKYTVEYKRLFFNIARTHHLPMIPFLLEGVAGDPRYNQGDGIHPNESGHRKIAELVTPEIEKIMDRKNPKPVDRTNPKSVDRKNPKPMDRKNLKPGLKGSDAEGSSAEGSSPRS